MRDLLRVDANERMDFEDFDALSRGLLEGQLRQVPDSLITKPGGQQMWVISGFAISNPAAQQLRVDRGVALLSKRDGVDVLPGFVTTDGDPYRILDLSTYSQADPHGVYVRFIYKQASTQGRLFWNATSEAEYAQSIPTRLEAGWELVVERANPGAEWFKLGEVTPNTMAIVDQRDFYFEGKVSDTYASDGWGGGTDRNADRQQYGIVDFQTWTEAQRTIIEEFRSTSGNRRWWETGVRDLTIEQGLRVGFTGNPTLGGTVAIGDNDFNLRLVGTNPFLNFDASYDDYLSYDRTANKWNWVIGGTTVAVFQTAGFTIHTGLRVGFIGTPIADRIELGDSLFYGDYNAGTPRFNYDTGDYSQFDRAGNLFEWRIASAFKVGIGDTGLRVTTGLLCGFNGTPTATLAVFGSGPANQTIIDWTSDNVPKFQFDSNDRMEFDRVNNLWSFRIGGANFLTLDDDPPGAMPKYVKTHHDLHVEDDHFVFYVGGSGPVVYFDGFGGAGVDADYMTFKRSDDTRGQWALLIAGATVLGANNSLATQAAAQAWARGRFSVGFDPAVAFLAPDYSLSIGDGNFYAVLGEASFNKPHISFDGINDSLAYDRSTNSFQFFVGSLVAPALAISGVPNGVTPGTNGTINLGSDTARFKDFYAYNAFLYGDAISPPSRKTVRNAQNNTVACTTFQFDAGGNVVTLSANRFNTNQTGAAGNAAAGTALIPLYKEVDDDAQVVCGYDSITAVNRRYNITGKINNAVSPGQIEIQGYDEAAAGNGLPTTVRIYVTVTGRHKGTL